MCIGVQAMEWCKDSFDDMTGHLTDLEEDQEFVLKPADAAALRGFLMGQDFDPILAALDADITRVDERKERALTLSKFKAYTRFRGKQELSRWLDEDRDYDPDEYADLPNAKIPLNYIDWQALVTTIESGIETPGDIHQVAKALGQVVHIVAQQQWKLDHLLRVSNESNSTTSHNALEELKAKYPFLHNCDDHVSTVPNVAPMQLSRSRGVRSFPSFRMSCSCVFFSFATVWPLMFYFILQHILHVFKILRYILRKS